MNASLRSRTFPKTRHFGFKRPVFVDPENDDIDNEKDQEKEEEDKKITETKPQPENPAPKKMDIQLLSFSISTEILSLQESSSAPGFDWIHESESKEKIFNDSNFAFDEPDFSRSINDSFDQNPII
ncbi:hypothetical protein M9Y10_022435 [Tritrichomonas musculus]|uniref:Uncharacterized protein n=1 Tax=Tritrichomonas musculus TaxID=1915356 RepID=A0ABR2KSD8_9EUKA